MKNAAFKQLYKQYQQRPTEQMSITVQKFLGALPYDNLYSSFVKTLEPKDIIAILSNTEPSDEITADERFFFIHLIFFYDNNLFFPTFSNKEYSFLETARIVASERSVKLSKNEKNILAPCTLTTLLILNNQMQTLIDLGYSKPYIPYLSRKANTDKTTYFEHYSSDFFAFLQLAYNISSEETVKKLLDIYFKKTSGLSKIQPQCFNNLTILDPALISFIFNHYFSILKSEQSKEEKQSEDTIFLTEERRLKLLRLAEILAQSSPLKKPTIIEQLILFPTLENMLRSLLPDIGTPTPNPLMMASTLLVATFVLAPIGLATTQLATQLDFRKLVDSINKSEKQEITTLVSVLPKRFSWLLVKIINNTVLSTEQRSTLLSILNSRATRAPLTLVSSVANAVFAQLNSDTIAAKEKQTTGLSNLLSWVIFNCDETDEPKAVFTLKEIVRNRNHRIAGTSRDYSQDPSKATNVLYLKVGQIIGSHAPDFTEDPSPNSVELASIIPSTGQTVNENDPWIKLHRNIFAKLESCTVVNGETRDNYMDTRIIPECREYCYFIKDWLLPFILSKSEIGKLESLDIFSSSSRLPRSNGSQLDFSDNTWNHFSNKAKPRAEFRKLVQECARTDITSYLNWLEARSKRTNMLAGYERRLYEDFVKAKSAKPIPPRESSKEKYTSSDVGDFSATGMLLSFL